MHSDEKPFSCNYTGCSFCAKRKGNLTSHQKQVHLKITTKCCHVCDKRFFMLSNLRDHMMSHHQTKDHDIVKCDHCVTYLKKNHRMSEAIIAANKRKVGKKGTHSAPANTQDIRCHKKEVSGEVENAFALKEEQIERQTHRLNVDLIEMHMDMQLLSSL